MVPHNQPPLLFLSLLPILFFAGIVRHHAQQYPQLWPSQWIGAILELLGKVCQGKTACRGFLRNQKFALRIYADVYTSYKFKKTFCYQYFSWLLI
jgi:hypothetical protein